VTLNFDLTIKLDPASVIELSRRIYRSKVITARTHRHRHGGRWIHGYLLSVYGGDGRVYRSGVARWTVVTERPAAAHRRLHDVRRIDDSAWLSRDHHVDRHEQAHLRHRRTGARCAVHLSPAAAAAAAKSAHPLNLLHIHTYIRKML